MNEILYVFLGFHALLAFYVCMLVLECPFKSSGRKATLLFCTIFLPVLGPLVAKRKVAQVVVRSSGKEIRTTSNIPEDTHSVGGSSDGGSGE